jgi:uncharacterized protein (DUF983 family)
MNATNTVKPHSFGKCPACGNGDIFRYPVQNIAHFAEMHPACPVCKVSYHPEPGFYFGAMYITYAINVVLVVVVGALANYVLDIRSIFQLLIIAIAAVLITPFSFRFSRILWLYWFGGIKPRSDAD